MINNQYINEAAELSLRMLTLMELNLNLSINKSTIDDVRSSSAWPKTHEKKDGYGKWDWESLWSQYRKKHLCMSIKIDGLVCALFCGRVRSNYLNIEFIQRNYACESIKGYTTKIVIIFSYFLAKGLSKELIQISDPAPKIVKHYESVLGEQIRKEYSDNGECSCMEARVDDVYSHLSSNILPATALYDPEIITGSSSM